MSTSMTLRRCAAVVGALAVVASMTGASASTGGAPGRGVFLVGAASTDITPPPPGASADVTRTGCTPVGAGPFTGRRQFGLEEPYADLNGNGHYDAPDPTTGAHGEPFLDCPTPTATGGLRPPDGRWDGIYLGGGDCCDRLADGTVFDRLTASAMVVAAGGRRIAIVSADNEGIFKEIWDEVRAKVAADGTRLDAVFTTSTHDESAPDTIGITGPTQTTSGVDPFYVEFLVSRVAAAIDIAAHRLRPAYLRYGSVYADDLVPCWSSYPFTADENVGVLQARAAAGGRVIATVVDYGIHAEELGFDPKTRRDVSADWWHFLRAALQRRFGSAPVLAVPGPVGSVEMPLILRGPRDPLPVGTHAYSSRDGCTTIYSGPRELVPHEGGYDTYTRTLGDVVARWALRALHDGAWSRSGDMRFRQRTIFAPIDNALFLAAGPACVFDYRILYTDGLATGVGTPPACGAGNEIATDIGWFSLGDGSFVLAPGELFPFTYDHDFHGPGDLPVAAAGPVHGWVTARLGGRWRFVVGLGDDLSGYIFPANNEVGTPTLTNPTAGDVDRFGCHHVDDAEASSGGEGDVVDDALLSMLPATRADGVAVGRYVYADGTLHRDPTGDGRLGCNAASARFRPAPDGGAVGIWLAAGGRRFFVRASAAGPVTRGAHWIDLRGVAQSYVDEQTRGIQLADGSRIWLDVYPDVATPSTTTIDQVPAPSRAVRASR